LTHSEGARPGLLARIFVARPGEMPAVLGGFLLFFLLFTSWFMLRPVRETFGIAGGVDNLQWLFLGTFLATLVVVPLYGTLSSRIARKTLFPAAYLLSALVMAGFAFGLWTDPGNVWTARAFYVWSSVFNLFVVSLAWSVMADVFNPEQGHRLFGQIAAGASLGGLTGPLLSGVLVEAFGHAGLLLLSTSLLVSTLGCAAYLHRWRRTTGQPSEQRPPERPIGGSIWAGLTTVLRSPYLLSFSAFIVLATSAGTFLYFEQARIVEATFPDPVRQTQVFSAIDATVQALTIGIQLFLTGRLAKRLGVTFLLAAVPVAMIFGFTLLALIATFPLLAAVMVARRVGEYGLVRPGREMIFTAVDTETKYKAKNTIDTVVYRGGDALAAWANAGIVAIGSSAVALAIGAMISAIWALFGLVVGRQHDRLTEGRSAATAAAPA
jgi:ATP:ADP antiporter, AAA family